LTFQGDADKSLSLRWMLGMEGAPYLLSVHVHGPLSVACYAGQVVFGGPVLVFESLVRSGYWAPRGSNRD
jgi:hypothetical protein